MTPTLYRIETPTGINGPYFDTEIYELWSRKEITAETNIALVTENDPNHPKSPVFIPFKYSNLYRRMPFVEAKTKSPEAYRLEEQLQMDAHAIEFRERVCFYLKWICVLATITFVLLVLLPSLMALIVAPNPH